MNEKIMDELKKKEDPCGFWLEVILIRNLISEETKKREINLAGYKKWFF